MRNLVSPLRGIESPFGSLVDFLKDYIANGIRPSGVLDFGRGVYVGKNGRVPDASEIVTFGTPGLALMTDSDGLLKWNPHNLLTYSEDFSNAAWSNPSGVQPYLVEGVGPNGEAAYKVETGTGWSDINQYSGGTTGQTFTGDVYIKSVDGTAGTFRFYFSALDFVTDLTIPEEWELISASKLLTSAGSFSIRNSSKDFYILRAHLYRSDQGGMAPVPVGQRIAGSETYVPTTSAPVYHPRENDYLYDAATSSYINNGLFLESEARTQLLHTTNDLVTQSHTVTAVPHTLHFTGTGTVTLSGASTDGPLVGTGTGNQNRVSLTFTPTAASLTLTVSGTVTDAQLEVGSTPSSYIPNLAASGIVTRAAQTAVIEPANNPLIVGGVMPAALSIGLKGKVTYADEGVVEEVVFVNWRAGVVDYIRDSISTLTTRTGESNFVQRDTGSGLDVVTSSTGYYSPGINVPFNIASRHGATFINGAVDGTALTANTTPTALPDLVTSDFRIGPDFMGHIQELPLYAANVADAGLEEITS